MHWKENQNKKPSCSTAITVFILCATVHVTFPIGISVSSSVKYEVRIIGHEFQFFYQVFFFFYINPQRVVALDEVTNSV